MAILPFLRFRNLVRLSAKTSTLLVAQPVDECFDIFLIQLRSSARFRSYSLHSTRIVVRFFELNREMLSSGLTGSGFNTLIERETISVDYAHDNFS